MDCACSRVFLNVLLFLPCFLLDVPKSFLKRSEFIWKAPNKVGAKVGMKLIFLSILIPSFGKTFESFPHETIRKLKFFVSSIGSLTSIGYEWVSF